MAAPETIVVTSTVTLAAPEGGAALEPHVPTTVPADDPYIQQMLAAGYLTEVSDTPVAVAIPNLPDMSWKRPDLVTLAEDTYGITTTDGMTKEDLIAAITAAAGEQAAAPSA